MKKLLFLFSTIWSNRIAGARVAAAFALLVLLYLVPARTAAGAMKLLSPDTGSIQFSSTARF